MFGGTQKSGWGGTGGGRGGRGGGGGKRNVYALQNPSRASNGGGGGGGRLSLGGSGPRGRNPPVSATAQSAAADETFSLVARSPMSFAATLRLPPDLVEEIKRVEAQGGAAKIKFDSYPNNPSGNVIDVGGKEFRFTWSREISDLCDIYEEPQNNEDSNGLLVESGCAYRKLNVHRTLDESTKNHLKMRSEEAERKAKARKTMVLEPSNPSTKSQMKALAAADASPWKFHKKEPPFKKRKFESTQVGGPPKVVHKSGFPSATSARGRHSSSPLPSPPVQSVSLVSPSVAGNPNKTPANTGAATPINATAEDNVTKPERDASGKTFPGVPPTAGRRANESSVSADLQSMLTSLLKDNPNGMSLKALEKAVGDVFPSSSRKIEPILKKIATYQAPGKYILNSEAERGSLKRCSQSGSSSEGNGQQVSVSREKHDDVASQKLVASVEKSPDPHVADQATLDLIFGEDPDFVEKIDISQNSPDPIGEKNIEEQAARSSDSGSDSDSDSDSSDSGSDSGSPSRSRSRSPAESGSGSSSDSESDSSSNSKEGSDVEVDIISDDENEPKHAMQASDQGCHTSPGQWRTPDDRIVENGIVERMDDQESEDVDIEGDQDIDVGTALDLAPNAEARSTEEFRPTLPNEAEHEEHWSAHMIGKPEQVTAGDMKQENQEKAQRSKSKSKKAPRIKKSEEVPDHSKRLKGGRYAESPASRFEEILFSQRPPDKLDGDQYKDNNPEMEDRYDKDDNVDFSQSDYGYQGLGKVAVEQQSGARRPNLWSHDSDPQDKSYKYSRSDNIREPPVKQKTKMHRDNTQDGKGDSYEKTNRKAQESVSGNKHAPQLNSLQRKQPDQMKKFQLDSRIGLSQQDGNRADPERFPPVTGRKNILHRELSDLELGELREPMSMELDGNNNQFQRQGSFKQFDTKVGTSDSLNVNLNKGKPVGKPTTDFRPSSPVKGVRNDSSKRSPSLHDEAFENNMIGLEGYGETHKKANARRQSDLKQEHASFSGKGTKSQKSNPSAKGVSKVRDAFSNDVLNDNRKSESSSDENSSFSKYEKEKPDLKEPVKDIMQYKEYVQEYTEKYSTYCSLNKVLENCRNEFHKMGKDLESAKSKDTTKYYRVLRQLRESYQQHGEKHKRLKKIFIVLHEELKHLKQRITDFAAAYSKD